MKKESICVYPPSHSPDESNNILQMKTTFKKDQAKK